MGEEKTTHGGARVGSGRKKGGMNKGEHRTGRIVISCLESDVELVKSLAQQSNKTVSQFIIDLVKNQ